MVHDSTSRAAARDLLAESDVVASDELTDALAELRSLGERPAPKISPALAEAMRQAAAPADQSSGPGTSGAGNVVALPFGKSRVRRRGAAVGGAVVLAMAAGVGGVAAFGPDNAVETAIESVIRWAAPPELTEPASEEQPARVQPESVPVPDAPPVSELPTPAPPQPAPELTGPGELAPTDAPAEPETPAPATPKGQSTDPGEPSRGAVPPVELPELPVPLPDPVATPRSVVPVTPPQLPVPGGATTPAPSSEPSR